MKVCGLLLIILNFFYMLITSFFLKIFYTNLNYIIYYWLILTLYSCYNHCLYLIDIDKVNRISNTLWITKKNIWFKEYELTNKNIFKSYQLIYSEYNANNDREYQQKSFYYILLRGIINIIFGIISILILFYYYINYYTSILLIIILTSLQIIYYSYYIKIYLKQTDNLRSRNLITLNFPLGYYLLKRPMIYINLFYIFINFLVIFLISL